MRRREFITLLGGAAAAGPLAARAQQPMLVIGFLGTRRVGQTTHLSKHLRRGLGDAGFVDGDNLVVEYRWAEGRYDRLPALAAELVRRPVAALLAGGIHSPPLPAKPQPRQFQSSSIQAATRLYRRRPGQARLSPQPQQARWRCHGCGVFGQAIGSKQFELMHDVMPKAHAIAFLVNPRNAATDDETNEMWMAASALGQKLLVVRAAGAFATIVRERAGALILQGDPLINSRQGRLAVLSARHGILAVSPLRDYPAAGGLMSYGASSAEAVRLEFSRMALRRWQQRRRQRWPFRYPRAAEREERIVYCTCASLALSHRSLPSDLESSR